MAVANHFTFGNINTNDYDVVVEGYGNYTAPKRAVEMVSVPGRNGAVIIDQGYYENGEATFKCVIKARTQHEFQRKVSAFRNAITSQLGYQRLTEGYQADEYRMASYSGGLDDEPEFIGRAGKFEVNFTCKPQRYLLPGESSIAVSSGDTLYNPTPYDASPLLAVDGYGTIGFNGYEIEIENAVAGDTELQPARKGAGLVQYFADNAEYNAGDTITIGSSKIAVVLTKTASEFSLTRIVNKSGDSDNRFSTTATSNSNSATVISQVSPITFTAGTSGSVTNTFSMDVSNRIDSAPLQSYTSHVEITITFTYTASIPRDPESDMFTLQVDAVKSGDGVGLTPDYGNNVFGETSVYSTKTVLGDPTYIDCDLGDAYMVKDGSYISLNRYLDLGSDLPTLASGQNEFTIDNTITSLEVTPRYWIL